MPDSFMVNPNILRVSPYNAGLSTAAARQASGRQDIARLASNENPYGCSPLVVDVIAAAAIEPWRYADPACTALRGALGASLDIATDRILVGNGSEELIAAICRMALRPADEVVTVAPSFGLHEIEPVAAGACVHKIAMTARLDFDYDALERAIARGPRIVFLSSPWNPVGTALDAQRFQRLVDVTGPQTLLVLDEAYVEFVSPEAAFDSIAMLDKAAVNYVVLRTFSKAYGLAGLRVGYGIFSDPRLAGLAARAKTPFNVNTAAQHAAVAALADEAWMKDAAAMIVEQRLIMEQALLDAGYRPASSEANFVFFDCCENAASLAERLLKVGIIVKPWREPGFETFMRVSVGLPAENQFALEAIRSVRRL
ncbi:aminotransferase class I/II-fold pyridoxal phosphate-dependent enzyme [Bosea sp. RAF48]|uniref:aminotransferase class I/II-fold pyridoxal phosphate-dependent enzyme n=1 Tax=Bosea sp. RAF48 TaxID=3237480 RepID=UPI003F93C55F